MHIARRSPGHAPPRSLPDARRTPLDVAVNVVDALDRLCADSHRDEWNVFLLDIRQEAPGEFLARVGIFGPVEGELTIHARPLVGDNGVPSTVTQAVAAWIAKYDHSSMSPGRPRRMRAATGGRASRIS